MAASRIAPGRTAGRRPASPDERTIAEDAPGTSGTDAETGGALLGRFGDAIDDRISEILDELLDERDARRPARPVRSMLAAVSLILALAASVLLRRDPLAAWTIWPCAATVALAATWAARNRRS